MNLGGMSILWPRSPTSSAVGPVPFVDLFREKKYVRLALGEKRKRVGYIIASKVKVRKKSKEGTSVRHWEAEEEEG